jgi:hypothetical protein
MCHVFLVWQSILYITQPSGVKKSMIISRWVIIQKSCREDPCFLSFSSILLAVVNDETCMGGRSMSVIFFGRQIDAWKERTSHSQLGQSGPSCCRLPSVLFSMNLSIYSFLGRC